MALGSRVSPQELPAERQARGKPGKARPGTCLHWWLRALGRLAVKHSGKNGCGPSSAEASGHPDDCAGRDAQCRRNTRRLLS